MSAIDLLGLI